MTGKQREQQKSHAMMVIIGKNYLMFIGLVHMVYLLKICFYEWSIDPNTLMITDLL